MKPARWACCSGTLARRLASLLACAALLCAAPTAGAQQPVLRIDQAEFVLSDSAEPPPDTAPWQAQTLPDNWRVSRPGVAGFGWYRLSFDLPRPPDFPYAIFTPTLRTIGAVYVNGVLVGRTDPFGTTTLNRRPHYFVVSPSTLRSGSNSIHVRVFTAPGYTGGLAAPLVGVDARVRPEFEQRFFWQVTSVQFDCALAAIFGVISLLLWLRRRQDLLYVYFGLAALSWAAYISSYIVRYPPVPVPWWGAMTFLAGHAKLLFMMLFAVRYAGWRWPRTERALWVWIVISAFVIYAADVRGIDFWLLGLWERSWMLVALSYAGVLAVAAWQLPTPQRLLLALTASIHPILHIYFNFFPSAEALILLPNDFLPMQLVVGWILVDRFANALDEAERLNAELEQRVAQKHTELERNYAQMQQLTREAAVAEERQRIMSDMHDGIGGQLISTLSLVEHGEASSREVAAALRECIDDLRLTIDSLEPAENDLLPALGNFRYRLDGRLKQVGVKLDWRVQELPKLACLTPRNLLHVLRILQEAFTNILKHAHADTIQVETGVDAEHAQVFIRIRDNGQGFVTDLARHGHGIANMTQRAKTVGGELRVLPTAAGTTLDLLLPVG